MKKKKGRTKEREVRSEGHSARDISLPCVYGRERERERERGMTELFFIKKERKKERGRCSDKIWQGEEKECEKREMREMRTEEGDSTPLFQRAHACACGRRIRRKEEE